MSATYTIRPVMEFNHSSVPFEKKAYYRRPTKTANDNVFEDVLSRTQMPRTRI